MGDDVAGAEDLENLVEERRRLADMHHQRQLQDLGDLLGDLDRRDAPGAEDHVAGPHLDADDDVAVGLDAGDGAIDVDRADVDEFADAVAGDEADRADVEEGLDALARRLDDVFAKAMEIGLAGRAGIDDGRDAALDAAELRPDRDVGAAMPDMGVQIDPAGRDDRRPSPSMRRAPSGDASDAPTPAMLPSAPIRMSIAS